MLAKRDSKLGILKTIGKATRAEIEQRLEEAGCGSRADKDIAHRTYAAPPQSYLCNDNLPSDRNRCEWQAVALDTIILLKGWKLLEHFIHIAFSFPCGPSLPENVLRCIEYIKDMPKSLDKWHCLYYTAVVWRFVMPNFKIDGDLTTDVYILREQFLAPIVSQMVVSRVCYLHPWARYPSLQAFGRLHRSEVNWPNCAKTPLGPELCVFLRSVLSVKWPRNVRLFTVFSLFMMFMRVLYLGCSKY